MKKRWALNLPIPQLIVEKNSNSIYESLQDDLIVIKFFLAFSKMQKERGQRGIAWGGGGYESRQSFLEEFLWAAFVEVFAESVTGSVHEISKMTFRVRWRCFAYLIEMFLKRFRLKTLRLVTMCQPPPQALLFSHRGERKTKWQESDWWQSARNHRKENKERRLVLPAFICAQIFIERETSGLLVDQTMCCFFY